MQRIGFTATPAPHVHRPPRECPVCGELLSVTRLGCPGCGSELSGLFAACAFCGLSQDERDVLSVFLASRGNMRKVEKHLGVSYPTARQRFAELLAKVGIAEDSADAVDEAPTEHAGSSGRDQVLGRLAAGQISVDEAEELLRSAGS
jgi:hypothetical protein